MQRSRWIFVWAAAAAVSACGGATDAGGGAVRVPASSGTVLRMNAEGRGTAPAAVIGFVHGLHAFVLDGDRVFAGMTPLNAPRGQNGVRTLMLANGLSAQLVPVSSGFNLQFSSGESIALHEQAAR